MEADFQRDYGIQLAEQIGVMTWRRFKALLDNLSPTGAVAARIRQESEKEESKPQDTRQAADSFFSTIMSI